MGNENRYTVDAVTTWKLGTANTFDAAYDAKMVDQNVRYECGFGEVRKTTDGGKTWVAHTLSLQGNLVGIDFADANTGWVVGDEGSIFQIRNVDPHSCLTRSRRASAGEG